jgi:hypothetical protein
MVLFGNDFGNITPKDSGIQGRCRFVRYRLTFVESEPKEGTDERKAEPEAKEWFYETKYKNSLFWVMVDTYTSMTYDEKRKGGLIEEPECVKEETSEWVGGDGGDDEFSENIRRRYDITGLETDNVPSAEIVDYIITECRLNLSANKIGRMLSKLITAKNRDCPKDRSPRGEEVGKQRLGIKSR